MRMLSRMPVDKAPWSAAMHRRFYIPWIENFLIQEIQVGNELPHSKDLSHCRHDLHMTTEANQVHLIDGPNVGRAGEALQDFHFADELGAIFAR